MIQLAVFVHYDWDVHVCPCGCIILKCLTSLFLYFSIGKDLFFYRYWMAAYLGLVDGGHHAPHQSGGGAAGPPDPVLVQQHPVVQLHYPAPPPPQDNKVWNKAFRSKSSNENDRNYKSLKLFSFFFSIRKDKFLCWCFVNSEKNNSNCPVMSQPLR